MKLLKANTSEATAVVRVGGWVIKILRPAESFATHRNHSLRASADVWLARWRRMTEASIDRPPLNRLWLVEAPVCFFVSRFVEGRRPTAEELQHVVRSVQRLRLGIVDVTRDNVVIGDRGPVVVDWFMR